MIPDVAASVVELPDDEAHHVSHVLRLESGDAVIVFDGRGGEWDAQLESMSKRGVTAAILQTRTPVAEPHTRVILAIGLLKGTSMDDVVRDATALGVAAIVPMITAHCVVPKRARGEEAVDRWRRVAIAAAKQCGRATLPEFTQPISFIEVLRTPADLRLMCVEPEFPGQGFAAVAATPSTAVVLVGPEGGWSSEEVAAARLGGYRALQLGPLVLRAELAPTVALSQLWAVLK